MNITKLTTITAALSATLLLNGSRLSAQDTTAATPAAAPATSGSAAPGGGGGPGGRGNRGQFFINMIKTQLKATDDEWAVIQPLLQKVQDAQGVERAIMAGGSMAFGGGPGGGGRRGGGNGGNPPAAALRQALPHPQQRLPAADPAAVDLDRSHRLKARR